MSRVVRLAFLAAWLCALPLAAAHAGEADDAKLAERIAKLRAPGVLEREFVETKQLALLAAPLESRGVMSFAPPDRLRWETREPEPSLLEVAGDVVEFSKPGAKPRRIDLTREPGARGLVDAVRLLLSGELAALRRDYELALSEDGAHWRLSLTPRAAALRRVVARMEFAGVADAPRELLLEFANGDRSRVLFEAAP